MRRWSVRDQRRSYKFLISHQFVWLLRRRTQFSFTGSPCQDFRCVGPMPLSDERAVSNALPDASDSLIDVTMVFLNKAAFPSSYLKSVESVSVIASDKDEILFRAFRDSMFLLIRTMFCCFQFCEKCLVFFYNTAVVIRALLSFVTHLY